MSELVGGIVVVGPGRIGRLFAELAADAGVPCTLVGRGALVPEGAGPVLVCTRNDDLDAVLGAVPAARRPDLVFVQNGMTRPWLEDRGLLGCTQGVLYVAVRWVGDTPVAGAPSVIRGRWAGEVVGLLAAGGIAARVAADDPDLLIEVGIKLAWICALGPVCGATGSTVGEACARHRADLVAICGEVSEVLTHELGVVFDPATVADRVLAYSASVPHFEAAVKEWRWRDGWLVGAASRHRVAMPHHAAWLARSLG